MTFVFFLASSFATCYPVVESIMRGEVIGMTPRRSRSSTALTHSLVVVSSRHFFFVTTLLLLPPRAIKSRLKVINGSRFLLFSGAMIEIAKSDFYWNFRQLLMSEWVYTLLFSYFLVFTALFWNNDCYVLIQHFWVTGEKLTSKNEDFYLLKLICHR